MIAVATSFSWNRPNCLAGQLVRSAGTVLRMAIDWEQGRRLYLQGKSPRDVAAAIGCNKSSVCRRVKSESWGRAEDVLASVARGVAPSRSDGQVVGEVAAVSAEGVQQRIQQDVSAVLTALEAVAPEDLALHQLAVRERIAGDVAKRAAGVFDIGESSQPVVNIAVLSQLPEKTVEGLR